MIRSFSTAITADPTFTRRSPAAQLLYFRLYFHPANHLCGLFLYSPEYMAVDLKCSADQIREALAELVLHKFVEVEPEADLVWIPEMAATLGKVSAPNHPIGNAIVKYLRGLSLRDSRLITRVATTLGLTLPPTLGDTLRATLLSGSGSGTDSGSGEHKSSRLSPAASQPVEPVEAVRESGQPSPRTQAPDLRHEHGERMTPPSPPRLTSRQEPPAGQQAQLALVPAREATPPRKPKAGGGKPDEPDAPTNALWEAYERAMMAHPVYGRGKPPLRNRKVNGLLAQLLKKMPREDAPEVIAFYVRHPDGWYIRKGHSIECLLTDAEKIYGEWSRDQPITGITARQHEQTASNPGLAYLAELEAERNRKK